MRGDLCKLHRAEIKDLKALLPVCGRDHQPLLEYISELTSDGEADGCPPVVALTEMATEVSAASSACEEMEAVQDDYAKKVGWMIARCYLIGRDKEKCMLDEGCKLVRAELKDLSALLPVCGRDHQ